MLHASIWPLANGDWLVSSVRPILPFAGSKNGVDDQAKDLAASSGVEQASAPVLRHVQQEANGCHP